MKLTLAVLCVLLPVVVSQQRTCSSDSDCSSGECCTMSILGKRKRLIFGDDLFGGSRRGTCTPLATEGHSCEPDMSLFGASRAHSFGCPCGPGLECHGEQESHNGGSHSYTNPTCLPAGTYTGSQQGSSGSGSIYVTQRPPVATEAGTPDPFQPVHEVAGR